MPQKREGSAGLIRLSREDDLPQMVTVECGAGLIGLKFPETAGMARTLF